MRTTRRIINFANRLIAGLALTVAADATAHVARATTIDLAGIDVAMRFSGELRASTNERSKASNDQFKFVFDGSGAHVFSERRAFAQRLPFYPGRRRQQRANLRWPKRDDDDQRRLWSHQQADQDRARFEWPRLWRAGLEPTEEGRARGLYTFAAPFGRRWRDVNTYPLAAENWLRDLFFQRIGEPEFVLDSPGLNNGWTANDAGFFPAGWASESDPAPTAVAASPEASSLLLFGLGLLLTMSFRFAIGHRGADVKTFDPRTMRPAPLGSAKRGSACSNQRARGHAQPRCTAV